MLKLAETAGFCSPQGIAYHKSSLNETSYQHRQHMFLIAETFGFDEATYTTLLLYYILSTRESLVTMAALAHDCV